MLNIKKSNSELEEESNLMYSYLIDLNDLNNLDYDKKIEVISNIITKKRDKIDLYKKNVLRLDNTINYYSSLNDKIKNFDLLKYKIIKGLNYPVEFSEYGAEIFYNKKEYTTIIKKRSIHNINRYYGSIRKNFYHLEDSKNEFSFYNYINEGELKYKFVQEMLNDKNFTIKRANHYFTIFKKRYYFYSLFINFNSKGIALLPKGKKNKEIQWNKFINMFEKLY